jgi:hypothetical protein
MTSCYTQTPANTHSSTGCVQVTICTHGPYKASKNTMCMLYSPPFPMNETSQEEQSQVTTHPEALSTRRPSATLLHHSFDNRHDIPFNATNTHWSAVQTPTCGVKNPTRSRERTITAHLTAHKSKRRLTKNKWKDL